MVGLLANILYSTKRWAGHAPKTSNHHCPCSYAGPKLRCCGTFSKLTGPVDEGTTMLFNLPASDGIIPSTQHLIYLLSSQPLNNYVCGRSDCKHCKCNYCDFRCCDCTHCGCNIYGCRCCGYNYHGLSRCTYNCCDCMHTRLWP